MKAFEFRLERIAEIWQKEAEISREQLQLLLNELMRLENERHALLMQSESERTVLARRTDLTGQDLMAFSQFQGHVTRRSKEIDNQKAKVQTKAEAQRLIVLEAERRVKLLDRLRERKLQDWKLESARELENLASDSHLARLAAITSAARASKQPTLAW